VQSIIYTGSRRLEWRELDIPAYVEFVFYRFGIQGDDSMRLWAKVFFSLRCGRRDLAMQALNESGSYVQQPVMTHLRTLLDSTVRDEQTVQRLANALDGRENDFLRAVLSVLGVKRNRETQVAQFPVIVTESIEDYLWINLRHEPSREMRLHIKDTYQKEQQSGDLDETHPLVYMTVLLVTLDFVEVRRAYGEGCDERSNEAERDRKKQRPVERERERS
jgi:hypothetical protein